MNNKCIILLLIIITIFFIILNVHEKFSNININSYSNFVKGMNKYKKKKYVLVFAGGPTLNMFKKESLPKNIYDDCHIIAVKNSINYLDKINVKPDLFVTNFMNSAKTTNIELLDKYKTTNIGFNYGGLKYLRAKMHHMTTTHGKSNGMKLVKEDKRGIEFKNINDKLITNWGHSMIELVLPTAIYLKPEIIITVGWDINGYQKYWDTKKEGFLNWGNVNVVRDNFSVFLHDYLVKHYNIKIYKINEKSAAKIPVFKLN